MPKIAQSNFDRGVRSQGRIDMPTVEPEVGKALERLGSVGLQIGQKMFQQQKTAEYLDWRGKKDAHTLEAKNLIRENANNMDVNGNYDYQTSDEDGNPLQRKGNINDDRKKFLDEEKKLNAEGDNLWMGESAKRHYTAKENQLAGEIGRTITTRKNKILSKKAINAFQGSLDDLLSGVTVDDPDSVTKLNTLLKDVQKDGAIRGIAGDKGSLALQRGAYQKMASTLFRKVGDSGDTKLARDLYDTVSKNPELTKNQKEVLENNYNRAIAQYRTATYKKTTDALNAVNPNDLNGLKAMGGVPAVAAIFSSQIKNSPTPDTDILIGSRNLASVGVADIISQNPMGTIDARKENVKVITDNLMEQFDDDDSFTKEQRAVIRRELEKNVQSELTRSIASREENPNLFNRNSDPVYQTLKKQGDIEGAMTQAEDSARRLNIDPEDMSFYDPDIGKVFKKVSAQIDGTGQVSQIRRNLVDTFGKEAARRNMTPYMERGDLSVSFDTLFDLQENSKEYDDLSTAISEEKNNENILKEAGIGKEEIRTASKLGMTEAGVAVSMDEGNENTIRMQGLMHSARIMGINDYVRDNKAGGTQADIKAALAGYIAERYRGLMANKVITEGQNKTLMLDRDVVSEIWNSKQAPTGQALTTGSKLEKDLSKLRPENQPFVLGEEGFMKETERIQDNPIELLREQYEPDYKAIRHQMLSGGMSKDSRAVKRIDTILASKDNSAKKLELFETSFGGALRIGRDKHRDNRVTIFYKNTPLTLKGLHGKASILSLTDKEYGESVRYSARRRRME